MSYCQFAMFDSRLDEPFNDWTDEHIAQGFSWRPECAAFSTLEEFGEHRILVHVTDKMEAPLEDAVRVIDVPFDVTPPGHIEIASISDSAFVDVMPGQYQLRYQITAKTGDAIPVIRLSFCPSTAPKFAVVRADADLRPGDELLLTASPA